MQIKNTAVAFNQTLDTRLEIRKREGMSDDRKVFGWTRRLSKEGDRLLVFPLSFHNIREPFV